jgi:hypothetical protein
METESSTAIEIGVCLGVGEIVGAGLEDCLGVGVGFGSTVTLTPLLQTNFFPDFTQVYL